MAFRRPSPATNELVNEIHVPTYFDGLPPPLAGDERASEGKELSEVAVRVINIHGNVMRIILPF
mgnify:CR=1 FL=1